MREELPTRKREILELAAQGLTDKEIAAQLGIEVSTVQSHWKVLRRQFKAVSRTEVLAKVRGRDAQFGKKLQDDENQNLLLVLAEAQRLRTELAEANSKLEAFCNSSVEQLAITLAQFQRKLTDVQSELEQLKKLEALTRQTGVIVHNGEYGVSWRKYYMSESVDFTGAKASQWINGEVSYFDFCLPEHLDRVLAQFKPFPEGSHQLITTYRCRSVDGSRHIVDFLTCEVPDDSGTGTYFALSLDLTKWGKLLRELVTSEDFENCLNADIPHIEDIAAGIEPSKFA
ncbi:MAG: helix-turn-helix transcriptional regulator [Armatimonadetes bacterium]|nr:helix-turn-helix transcriptional regulator [Armatimonadota bacterium]